jgi:hypothetical protein
MDALGSMSWYASLDQGSRTSALWGAKKFKCDTVKRATAVAWGIERSQDDAYSDEVGEKFRTTAAPHPCAGHRCTGHYGGARKRLSAPEGCCEFRGKLKSIGALL